MVQLQILSLGGSRIWAKPWRGSTLEVLTLLESRPRKLILINSSPTSLWNVSMRFLCFKNSMGQSFHKTMTPPSAEFLFTQASPGLHAPMLLLLLLCGYLGSWTPMVVILLVMSPSNLEDDVSSSSTSMFHMKAIQFTLSKNQSKSFPT